MISPKTFKWIAVIVAMFFPFIMILCAGEQRSISAYWNTAAQPLFIIMNATTSYFLFTTHNWQTPSLLLFLVTAFSVATYPIIHNILAVSFFIVCCIPMWKLHRFRWYLIPYILAGALTVYKLLYGETLAIMIICIYHAHVMLYVDHLKKDH